MAEKQLTYSQEFGLETAGNHAHVQYLFNFDAECASVSCLSCESARIDEGHRDGGLGNFYSAAGAFHSMVLKLTPAASPNFSGQNKFDMRVYRCSLSKSAGDPELRLAEFHQQCRFLSRQRGKKYISGAAPAAL